MVVLAGWVFLMSEVPLYLHWENALFGGRDEVVEVVGREAQPRRETPSAERVKGSGERENERERERERERKRDREFKCVRES